MKGSIFVPAYTMRSVAHHIARAFGKDPAQRQQVERFLNDRETAHIDIMTCPDTPYSGFASLSTMGLSGHDIGIFTGKGKPVRIELTAVCWNEQLDIFKGFLITSSFGIIDTHYDIYLHIIYPDIVPLYVRDSAMRHILFAEPFAWELEEQKMDDCLVAFLSPIPISDAEKEFILSHGADEFLDALEEAEADVGNIYRKSIY